MLERAREAKIASFTVRHNSHFMRREPRLYCAAIEAGEMTEQDTGLRTPIRRVEATAEKTVVTGRRALRESCFRGAAQLWLLGAYHLLTGGKRVLGNMRHLFRLAQTYGKALEILQAAIERMAIRRTWGILSELFLLEIPAIRKRKEEEEEERRLAEEEEKIRLQLAREAAKIEEREKREALALKARIQKANAAGVKIIKRILATRFKEGVLPLVERWREAAKELREWMRERKVEAAGRVLQLRLKHLRRGRILAAFDALLEVPAIPDAYQGAVWVGKPASFFSAASWKERYLVCQVPILQLWKDMTFEGDPKAEWDLTRPQADGGLKVDTTKLSEGILTLTYNNTETVLGSSEAAGQSIDGAKNAAVQVPMGGVVLVRHLERWAKELATMTHFSINMAKYGASESDEDEDTGTTEDSEESL